MAPLPTVFHDGEMFLADASVHTCDDEYHPRIQRREGLAMIRGMHGLLYSSDAGATRRFFREIMKFPGNDIGDGWWIFDFAEGDLGVHPIHEPADAGKHDVSFYCDDIHGTVADLKSRGVKFTQGVEDHGYGFVTYFTAPGGITIQLYEPRYRKGKARAPKKKGTSEARSRKTRAKKPPR